MSVRSLEEHVKLLNEKGKPKSKAHQNKPQFIMKHEYQLKEKFGTNIDIHKTKKSGKISLEFNSESEYKRIIELLLEIGRASCRERENNTEVDKETKET